MGPSLFFDNRHRLAGLRNTPHLVKGVHVKGQVIKFPLIQRNGTVDIIVEFPKLLNEIPNPPVVGMKNMGPIAVHRDSLYCFGIYISRDVGTLFQNDAAFSRLFCKVRDGGPVETGTNNHEIVVHQSVPLPDLARFTVPSGLIKAKKPLSNPI